MQEISTKFISNKFATTDKKIHVLDKKFDALDGKVSTLDRKFNNMEKRIDSIDEKIDNMGLNINARLTRLEVGFSEMNERTALIPKLYDNVDKLVKEILDNRIERVFMTDKLNNHENRICKLESA